MASTLETLLEEYKNTYFSLDNYHKENQSISDFIKDRMPKYLRTDGNKPFYDFLDKIFYYNERIDFYIWILKYQFSVLTAKGKFLDNLGKWLGLNRPPLPSKETKDPVVIFGVSQEESGLSDDDYKQMALLHNLTGYEKGSSTNTFFPLKSFLGSTLVNDDDYRIYILSVLKLKQGMSLPILINIFANILLYPFYITQQDDNIIEFTCHYNEALNRIIILQEICKKIRTIGFDIEIVQIETETSDMVDIVKQKYGDDCWERKNPYNNSNQ